jgi:hypothetical protein
MWAAAALSLGAALEETTLQDLSRRQKELDTQASPMYYI